ESAMRQQPRPEKPLYSCIVPLESVTQHQEEEAIAFGVSAEDAKSQAQQLLAQKYGCDEKTISQLMQQATIDSLSPWCPSSRSQN
ncbi:MAG: hypothetical protein ACRDEA_07920, partial [Microcystaceae cyanobacterium]